MAIVAIIIIGVAIFVFTHLSGLSSNQGFVLLGIAIVGLILVMGFIWALVRSIQK